MDRIPDSKGNTRNSQNTGGISSGVAPAIKAGLTLMAEQALLMLTITSNLLKEQYRCGSKPSVVLARPDWV